MMPDERFVFVSGRTSCSPCPNSRDYTCGHKAYGVKYPVYVYVLKGRFSSFIFGYIGTNTFLPAIQLYWSNHFSPLLLGGGGEGEEKLLII